MFRTSSNASSTHAIQQDVLPRHNPPAKGGATPPRAPVNSRLNSKTTVATRRGPKWTRFVSDKTKNHCEFVGTTLFLLFAFGGTNIANIPAVSVTDTVVNTSQLLYISLSFGFSLCVNAWVFFRVSGGLFNPAVSLGLALVGAITPVRAAILVVSQVLGGITGAAIIEAILPGPLYVGTALGGGISIAQGLFLEMFLTALLMLTILLLAAEKHKATFLAPVGIGLALFIAEMTGVYYTGGSLNPARSFGPAVVARSFPGYHWIYWLGPALGATLAAGFYKFIKYLQYEDANPDQDGADEGPSQFQSKAARLAAKIKRAEETTREKVEVHERVLQRNAASVDEVPHVMSASAVNAAKLVELSTKIDAVLAAVVQNALSSSKDSSAREVTALEAPHEAPFTVLL